MKGGTGATITYYSTNSTLVALLIPIIFAAHNVCGCSRYAERKGHNTLAASTAMSGR